MKKSIALLLASLLLFPTLAACNSESESEPANTTVGKTDAPAPSVQNVPATELDTDAAEDISYYTNPVLSSKDTGYGLGDPFVMRYNGSYYLYVTSPGKGIHCWKSDNLTKWSYKGMCAKEAAADGGYAPEVFYYNGMFYMYTSPHGNGHIVFASESPTGPFKAATGNIGMSIDGSVFIDSNGKWYFYTAGGNAIQAYTMSSPTKMNFSTSLAVTSMNNSWTEGPMVVYHDGYYYMTFTGNHFESLTYRINYVYGRTNPLTFQAPTNQPVLINTSPEGHHLGHSSTVKGPDLDSYYIVYHSMKDNGYNRDVNVDRIVFNGPTMEITGPTFKKQQTPDLPDIYARFKNGDSMDDWTLTGSLGSGNSLTLNAGSVLVSNHRFTGNYTAEYNVSNIPSGGMAGAVFSYTDTNNFGTCLFDPASQKVIITVTINGQSTVTEMKMVQSFKEKVKFDCIQSIQIEKNGSTYTFYMNDIELGKIKDCALPSGGIGYVAQGTEASFGFIGGTGAVGGRGTADDYKSVSELNGLIPANSYTIGQFPTEAKNKIDAVVAVEGNVLNYRIDATEEANYDLAAKYFTAGQENSAVAEIYVDGTLVKEMPLAGSKSFTTAIVRGIPLTKGQHTLSIKLKNGDASFAKFTLLASEPFAPVNLDYSQSNDKNVYTDGTWKIENGTLSIAGSPSSGKRLYGDRNWGDYTVSADVTPTSSLNCGLLFRVTDPGSTVRTPTYSQGKPTDADANASVDWVQGYYAGIADNKLVLAKLSYGYTQLKTYQIKFAKGTTYRLKVECEGATIKVYVDDQLYIEYTDDDPFIQGTAGVRAFKTQATFDNFKIETIG